MAGSAVRGARLVVIRRWGEVISAWAVATCVVAGTLWVSLGAAHTNTLPNEIGGVAVFLTPTWVVWRMAGLTRIDIWESGVLVVNPIRLWWIPWEHVADISGGDELVIAISDGRKLKASSGGGSLAGSLRGNPVQRKMRETIENARASCGSSYRGSAVVSKIDLGARYGLAVLLSCEVVVTTGTLLSR